MTAVLPREGGKSEPVVVYNFVIPEKQSIALKDEGIGPARQLKTFEPPPPPVVSLPVAITTNQLSEERNQPEIPESAYHAPVPVRRMTLKDYARRKIPNPDSLPPLYYNEL
jgi:hypothetical protein